MAITLEVRKGPADLGKFIPALRATFQAAFRRFITTAEAKAHAKATARFQRRTGRLDAGIGSRVTVQGLVLSGALTQREIHGVAQELGADIPARLIRPTKPGGVLHWMEGGQHVFARMSRPGPFHLPARPYLEPALTEAQGLFFSGLTDQVDRLARSTGF
jgi:hypothetical protein